MVLILTCNSKCGLAFCLGALIQIRDVGLLCKTRVCASTGMGNMITAALINAAAQLTVVESKEYTDAEQRWLFLSHPPGHGAVPKGVALTGYPPGTDALLKLVVAPLLSWCTANQHADILRRLAWPRPWRLWRLMVARDVNRELHNLFRQSVTPQLDEGWSLMQVTHTHHSNEGRKLPTFAMCGQRESQRVVTALTSDSMAPSDMLSKEVECELLRPVAVSAGVSDYVTSTSLLGHDPHFSPVLMRTRSVLGNRGDPTAHTQFQKDTGTHNVIVLNQTEYAVESEPCRISSSVNCAPLTQPVADSLFIREKGGIPMHGLPFEANAARQAMVIDGLGNTRPYFNYMSPEARSTYNRDLDCFMGAEDTRREKLRAFRCSVVRMVIPPEASFMDIPHEFRMSHRGAVPGAEAHEAREANEHIINADQQFFNTLYASDALHAAVDQELVCHCLNFGYLKTWRQYGDPDSPPDDYVFVRTPDRYGFFRKLVGKDRPGCVPTTPRVGEQSDASSAVSGCASAQEEPVDDQKQDERLLGRRGGRDSSAHRAGRGRRGRRNRSRRNVGRGGGGGRFVYFESDHSSPKHSEDGDNSGGESSRGVNHRYHRKRPQRLARKPASRAIGWFKRAFGRKPAEHRGDSSAGDFDPSAYVADPVTPTTAGSDLEMGPWGKIGRSIPGTPRSARDRVRPALFPEMYPQRPPSRQGDAVSHGGDASPRDTLAEGNSPSSVELFSDTNADSDGSAAGEGGILTPP